MKSWVPSLAPHKLGIVACTHTPVIPTHEKRQKDQEFKVILDYIRSLRIAWAL